MSCPLPRLFSLQYYYATSTSAFLLWVRTGCCRRVNLDRREYRRMGQLGDGWFDDHAMSLTRVLSRPLEKEQLVLDDYVAKIRRQVVDRHSLGALGKLPLEMIRAVFSEVTHIVDTAALALTNRSLVDFGLERVRDILHERAQAQSWAGDRLVCIGTYLEDIPEQILPEAEFSEFSKSDTPLYFQISASPMCDPKHGRLRAR
ncbi:hypothetical protein OF83DRAFT_254636 [Amylostereum chailletii]|nr:hypothetical protein OF83DRAFT_254636 [Amylostereum chailletii]